MICFVFLVACHAFADDDPECFSESEQSPACSCDLHASGIQAAATDIRAIRQKLVGSSAAQHKLEQDFFWDFLKDQYDQTSCQKDMLKALDILPKQGLCPDDMQKQSPKEAIERVGKMMEESPNLRVSKPAFDLQKEIINQVWGKLPNLAKADQDCKAQNAKLLSLQSVASHTSTFHGEKLTNGEVEAQIPDQEKKTAIACAARENLFQGLWSGQDPRMRTFVQYWIDRYRNDSSIRNDNTGANFLLEATGVMPDGHLKDRGDLSPQEWSRTLQGGVLSQMYCDAKSREKKLGLHVGPNGQPLPGTVTEDPSVNKDLKELLMHDKGQAALSYMGRTPKYHAVEKRALLPS